MATSTSKIGQRAKERWKHWAMRTGKMPGTRLPGNTSEYAEMLFRQKPYQRTLRNITDTNENT